MLGIDDPRLAIESRKKSAGTNLPRIWPSRSVMPNCTVVI
jgi:hypothetical protein